ncbi:hypothetical protein PQR71_18110 [Paraburkholderia fungorum]|uniref:hypothetical protein n=1 Tax=Paraburkholderia fungorum TaxID=134537 RepID=UPI0038BDFE7B
MEKIMGASCMSVEFIAAVSRAGVLLTCAFSGVLSIYLGWKLYKDAIFSQTAGDAAVGKYRIKLAAAGPGVFFALFGMLVLWKLIQQPASIPLLGPTSSLGYSSLARPSLEPVAKYRLPLLTLVADSNKPGGPCDAGARPVAAPCSCLIPRTLVFFTGGTVTPSIAKAGLSFAIDDLSSSSLGSTAATDKQKAGMSKDDAVLVLRTLFDNIVD